MVPAHWAGWRSKQGAPFFFTLTGCLVTTGEVEGGGRRQQRRRPSSSRRTRLWLKAGPAQVLPLLRKGPCAKVRQLPPVSSHLCCEGGYIT